jgi:hypothetical protein
MLNAVAEVTLNGITELDISDADGIYFYHFLFEGLPYGFFDYNDRSGIHIQQYENFQFGAKVDIILKNVQDDADTLEFPTFYILRVEDDFATDPSKLAGTIRVWFGHPWFIFKDDKNHAYNPMNHGKLIKKVLEDENRGVKLEINEDAWKETDDSGKFPRYKAAETDYDFICNKVLPYTTIEQLPPLFFCSLNKKKEEKVFKFAFNLTNSQTLYKQNPKILFAPTQEALSEGDNARKVKQILDRNNMSDSDILTVRTAKLKIFDESMISKISPVIYVEGQKQIKLGSKLKNKLSEKSGSEFGNLLPIDILYMEKLMGTSVNLIKNRRLMDALSLILSTGKELDNIFSLVLETNYCGDKITIGDTAYFFVPQIDFGNNKKSSWMSGRWIVNGIESYTNVAESGSQYQLFSRTYLSRPAFTGDTNETSLAMYQTLYEAK